MFKNIFLVSPVKEFHSYMTAGTELNSKYLRLLCAELEWATDYLKSEGTEVRDILKIAGISGKESSEDLFRLFASKTWNKYFESECINTVSNWADVVALMPEAHIIGSDIVDLIKDESKKHYVPVVNIEKLIQVTEGEFRKELDQIENAFLNNKNRSKILARGARAR